MDVKPGYKQTDVGVIPDDWEVTTVGAEFAIQLGKMLDSEKNSGVPKPYLGNRAVQWGQIDLSGVGIVKMTPSDIQRFRLREGDLLVCEGGEVGRAAIWDNPVQECYYQKALHRLRPIRSYNVQLMLNMLQRLASTGFLLNFVTQTSIAHLPKDKFEKVPIPIPPTKAEQRAIADALSDVDALIAVLDRLIAKKRDIKQAAMKELLTGKKRLPGFACSKGYKQTEVGLIPENWEIRSASSILNKGRLGGNYPNQDKETNYPLIKMGNIGRGNIDNEKIEYIIDGVVPNEMDRLRYGDLLFNTRNTLDLVGKVAVWRDELPLAYYNSNLMRLEFKPDEIASTFFANYAFNSTGCISRLREIATGTTSVAAIYTRDLLKIPFPLPPLPEQHAIATVLSDMDAEIAALEARLDKTRALKQGMMQELLTGRIRLV